MLNFYIFHGNKKLTFNFLCVFLSAMFSSYTINFSLAIVRAYFNLRLYLGEFVCRSLLLSFFCATLVQWERERMGERTCVYGNRYDRTWIPCSNHFEYWTLFDKLASVVMGYLAHEYGNGKTKMHPPKNKLTAANEH